MAESDKSQPYLSVIIPAYNEARRLGPALEQIRSYFQRTGLTAEVIVVDDGSTDGTGDVVRRFEPGPLAVRCLRNRVNRGKGYSVRRGMRRARGRLLLMTDADQSTPIWEVEKLLPLIERGAEVVIGSRDAPGSRLEPPQGWLRRAMGWVMRFARRRLMLRDIRDTQCGFKLFTRRAARAIFARQRTCGFAFDVEVLLLARRMGLAIREVGVLWRNDPDSRVRPLRDAFGMVGGLLEIWWRLGRAGRPPTIPKASRRGRTRLSGS
ncbi:MAG: glycosyltransferase, partial [Planctomycetes bacterium]|nr:glycosyltransferase [Planctomycetota bacterium]